MVKKDEPQGKRLEEGEFLRDEITNGEGRRTFELQVLHEL